MNFNTQQASQQESEYYSELDERLNYFYLGTWPNEAMNLPVPFQGPAVSGEFQGQGRRLAGWREKLPSTGASGCSRETILVHHGL